MNFSSTSACFFLAVSLLLVPSGQCFFLGPLLSLTLLPYTIVYNLSGIAGVKIALAVKLLGLLSWWRAGISDDTLSREVDLRTLELPTGAMFPGTPNLPLHMVPGIMAEIMRSMLQDDNVGTGFFQRSARTQQQEASWDGEQAESSPYVGGGVWPRMPYPARVVGGGYYPNMEPPSAGAGLDKFKRNAPLLTTPAMPPRGWYRQPRYGEKATVSDLLGYTVEMIQDIDVDGCMLKLCCEVGAEPAQYGAYGRRLAAFIRELHSLGGDDSQLRRYEDAFEDGRRQFKGDKKGCTPAYSKCRYDMQKITELVA